jgi:hypothetical protein
VLELQRRLVRLGSFQLATVAEGRHAPGWLLVDEDDALHGTAVALPAVSDTQSPLL